MGVDTLDFDKKTVEPGSAKLPEARKVVPAMGLVKAQPLALRLGAAGQNRLRLLAACR